MDNLQHDEWALWRRGVVAEIRSGFREQLGSIEDHEVDWGAWLPLFLEGCSPRVAVDKAFLRHAM